MKLRVLLDNNAIDPIVDNPEWLDLFIRAVADGYPVAYISAAQADELDAIAEPRRSQLRRLPLEPLPTAGAVFGHSSFGMATFTTAQDAATLDHVTTPAGNHLPDALLLTTARAHGLVTVLLDRRDRAKCADLGIEAMEPGDLIARPQQDGCAPAP